ncbi:peptidase family M48-domain-containing protein [Coniochaeta sp. 2T2.1]|nr:peptidase family M48-domain-containing protein [Coniochaeta sp. 2T2.1]
MRSSLLTRRVLLHPHPPPPSSITASIATSFRTATPFRSLATRRSLRPTTATLLSRPPPIPIIPTCARAFRIRRIGPADHITGLETAKPLFSSDQMRRAVRSPSTHVVIVIAVAGALIFYFANLETVPVSGRTRFNCYSTEAVREVGETQAKMVKYELERSGGRLLPDWDRRTTMVKRVMAKLIPFSGMADERWEVYVIEDPHTANAFVLPGGKVFVYSGILPLVRNDDGLAAVLGHEIAHNVADHIGERMSQSIGVNALMYSLVLLSAAFGAAPFVMQIFGGTLMDIAFARPMGRLQESEADYIGLMMMAEACYDPREAVGFWRRMDKAQQDAPPEWMSTHPSNQSRIEKIQEWLPKAMDKREASDCRSTTAFADLFQRARRMGVLIEA